ncbi:MAG: TIGR01777 family oxidoreductase [Kibdelosporangium sp.]
MGLVWSSVVDAPQDEVFAWHGRPGAFVRLSPPWQPVRIASEAESLRDGKAVLALPGGLRWVAQHQRDGYDPPDVFVDQIAPPLSSFWRHTHQFAAEGPGRTRITDRVDTVVPTWALREMFAYRHRQLARDLAVHQRMNAQPMTIAVTGSRGLIGTALTALLTTGGHQVIRLVRRAPRGAGERRWDPADPGADLLDGVDAVIHLAGESIAGRFTDEHKSAMRASRIGPTRRLAELAGRSGLRCFVSASAIGFYGADRGDEVLTEDSARGDGFLANLVADWENATSEAGLRVVCVRTGIVQSPRGGVLRLLYPLFFAGLGGRIGPGTQWTSWIGIDDLCDIYLRALVDSELAGPVNAVSPHPVRNSDYTRTLARVLHRPAVLPVPSVGPRVLLGAEGASELALANQRIQPERLLARGHQFRHPTVEQALRHVLGRSTG